MENAAKKKKRGNLKAGEISGLANFKRKVTQEEFGHIVGLSQQEISKLCRYNVLGPGGSLQDWTIQYLRFLMGQTFARGGWKGLAKLNGFED